MGIRCSSGFVFGFDRKGKDLLGSALALVLGAAPAAATTYYVSSTGRDSNSGTTSAQGWRTLDRVNSQHLRAGDTVLLEGGHSFPGTLILNAEGGTSTAPITFGSYGTGRATLSADRGRGVDIYNCAGVRIQDLVIADAGTESSNEIGISLFTDLPGDVKLSWIRIDDVRVTGFKRSGISIGGGNGRSGFQDVRVERSQIDHNGDNGMFVWADSSPSWPQTIDGYAHRSLYIGHNSFESNWGDPAITNTHTGSGRGGQAERS
jgi:hypothetical protein